MELLKSIHLPELAIQIINFLVLLVLLRLFFWNKFLGALDARKQAVAENLQAIEDSRQSAAALKKDYEQKLLSIEQLSRQRLQEVIEEGRAAAERLKQDAQADAQKIMSKAQEDITYEIAKAKEELKGQVVDIAIRAAEEVIQDKLTEDEDRRLVRDFIDKLGSAE